MESTRLVVQRVCMCVCVCEESARVYMKTYWRALCNKIVLVFILLVSLVYGEKERLDCVVCACVCFHANQHTNTCNIMSSSIPLETCFPPPHEHDSPRHGDKKANATNCLPSRFLKSQDNFQFYIHTLFHYHVFLAKKKSGTQPFCHTRLRRQISKFKTPPHFMTGTTLTNSFPRSDRDHVKQNFWLELFS